MDTAEYQTALKLPANQDYKLDLLEETDAVALDRLARACKHSDQMMFFKEMSHAIVLRSKRALVAAVLVGPEFDGHCHCVVLLHPDHTHNELEHRLLAYLTQHVQRRHLTATAYVYMRHLHMLQPYLSHDWWMVKSDQDKCFSFQNTQPAFAAGGSRLVPLKAHRAIQSMLQAGWVGHGHIMAGNDSAAWMLKAA
jgi:hypothetical protein